MSGTLVAYLFEHLHMSSPCGFPQVCRHLGAFITRGYTGVYLELSTDLQWSCVKTVKTDPNYTSKQCVSWVLRNGKKKKKSKKKVLNYHFLINCPLTINSIHKSSSQVIINEIPIYPMSYFPWARLFGKPPSINGKLPSTSVHQPLA